MCQLDQLFTGDASPFETIRQLPLAKSIATLPRFAHAVFTLRSAAFYIYHANWNLKARSEVSIDMYVGVRDGIADIRLDDNDPLSEHNQGYFYGLFGRFMDAIGRDVAKAKHSSGAVGVFESPSTKVLLEALRTAYDDVPDFDGLNADNVVGAMCLLTLLNDHVGTLARTITEEQMRITLNDPQASRDG